MTKELTIDPDKLVEIDIPVTEGEAALFERKGMRVAGKSPPSLISNQLRDELIRILKTGDEKNSGAFTIAIAVQVEKFVAAAREILMTESLAQNDLGSLMAMRKHHNIGPWSPMVGGSGLLGSNDGLTFPPINNENFGVQAIRQLVDGFKTTNESPAKLVEALVIARENKLTDVIASLEKKLGVAKADSTPALPMSDDDAETANGAAS